MSKEDNTIRKSIGFNMDDPDESEDLRHAMKRKNFSRYVKQLIHLDRVHGRGSPASEAIEPIDSINSSLQEDRPIIKPGEKSLEDQVISKSLGGFL